MTRLQYNTVERCLQELDLPNQELFSYNYYAIPQHFAELEEKIPLDTDIFLLSPLDPYFYMVAGSFRQNQLPRHTRLMLVRQGKTVARLEITIPDKDILQVLNIQIASKFIP